MIFNNGVCVFFAPHACIIAWVVEVKQRRRMLFDVPNSGLGIHDLLGFNSFQTILDSSAVKSFYFSHETRQSKAEYPVEPVLLSKTLVVAEFHCKEDHR